MTQEQDCSDFPIACPSCLGTAPYLQLKKEDRCMKCKLCTQPFTVFGWKPYEDAKFKKTIVCKMCANLRNVCQLCLQGLNHDLPVQDQSPSFSINSNDYYTPHRVVNKQYFADEPDHMARDATVYKSTYGRAEPNFTLMRHQRRMPFYQRNMTPVCRYFQRSHCARGVACFYRHEMPITADFSEHNLEERYQGSNNPSMPSQRMGSLINSQPFKLNRDAY